MINYLKENARSILSRINKMSTQSRLILVVVVLALIPLFNGLNRTSISLMLDVQNAIRNGAELDDINWINSKNSVSTAELLEEIRIGLIVRGSKDKDLIDRLTILLNESKRLDPFNTLNEDQKIFFENIEDKLDKEYYSKIEDDITDIVQKLEGQNDLVDQYLASAERSERLSWIALILSIVSVMLALLQIFGFEEYSIQSFYRWIRGKFAQADEDADHPVELGGTDESTES